MKRVIFLCLTALVMLVGCGEINDRLDALEGRVDTIENIQIATINQQISSINNSLTQLKSTDKELGEYITALEAQADNLQTKLADANAKIDEVKSELSETINTEKANILAELEAFKTSVNGELDAIKTVIDTLKEKDEELDDKIETLQEYVDAELKATEDWATATFATLEQYNDIVATIAAIEGAIEGINESIAALETRLNEKIAKDIAAATATLSTDLQNAIKDITEAYSSAITSAKEELTEAYTTALQGAISTLETSMKSWVNEQLTAYSTIVDTEAKITILQSEVDGKLAAQKAYLEALVNALSSSVTTDITTIKNQLKKVDEAIAKNAEEIEVLRGELEEQKTELTEAYTAAIAEAISAAKGEMSKELADEIAAINERIAQTDVAAIEALVANCKTRMETIEADIAQLQIDVIKLQNIVENLLAQIQSITYIPTYDDGKATIDYHSKQGALDFQISPKSAINDLEKVWQSALSFKAVHTQTRAVDFIDLPITSFEADAANGVISIEVDGTNLGDEFFKEQIAASATLEVSDGNSFITSNYTNLTPNYIIRFEDKTVEKICLENWDTNGDGWFSYDEAAVVTDIGTVFRNWVNSDCYYLNIYAFTELKYFIGITSIPDFAFYNRDSYRNEDSYQRHLCRISLPGTIKTIGYHAFTECHLYNIELPQSVQSIASTAFYYCPNLTKVTIPETVTSIGRFAFANCI